MSHRRFFIESASIHDGRMTITGSDCAHIRKVLRLSAGDSMDLCDEHGRTYAAVIERVDRDGIEVEVSPSTQGARPPEVAPFPRVALFIGLPKSAKMDTVVRGATEVGVDRICPILTSRTVPKPKDVAARLERWRRIAKEASKQSRRGSVPRVSEPLEWEETLRGLEAGRFGIVFWEEATRSLEDAVAWCPVHGDEETAVLVGPEGGLSAEEVGQAVACGAVPVRLDFPIMRTETAAVVAVALVLNELKRKA